MAQGPRPGAARDPRRHHRAADPRVPARRPRRTLRPAPDPRPEALHRPAPRPGPARVLPRPPGRRPSVHHGHRDLADEQHQRARRPAPENPAEDLRPPHQHRRHPAPPRHPQLHRHRPQARPGRHDHPPRRHDRQPVDPASTSLTLPADKINITSRARGECLLGGLGIRQSVGRTGICFDNALAESFNASLKVERVHRTVYPTRRKAKEDIARYIELRYNRARLHSGLGYRTPQEVHNEYLNRQLAA